jgi:hypothetical protein
MDDIGSIISLKDFSKPSYMVSLQNYLVKYFAEDCKISESQKSINVFCSSAAAAQMMRFNAARIAVACSLPQDKKLYFKCS